MFKVSESVKPEPQADAATKDSIHKKLSAKFNQELHKTVMIAALNAKQMGSIMDWFKDSNPPLDVAPEFSPVPIPL